MVLIVWEHIFDFAFNFGVPTTHAALTDSGLNDISSLLWFHMPAFAALTGLHWQPLTWARCQRLCVTVLAPLVIFASVGEIALRTQPDLAAMTAANPLVGVALGSGPGMLWFLRSLLVWRLLAEVLHALRVPDWLLLPLAVGGGGAAAAWGGGSSADGLPGPYYLGPFACYRSVQLFPFHVVGQTWLRPLWERAPPPRPLSMLATWLLLVSAILLGTRRSATGGLDLVAIHHRLETFPHPYVSMLRDNAGGSLAGGCPAARAILPLRYVLGLSLRLLELIAFLVCAVPRHATWLTPWGQHTIYPFLLQPIAVFGLLQAAEAAASGAAGPAVQVLLATPLTCLPITLAASIATTLALSSAPVRLVTAPLVAPQWLVGAARGACSRAQECWQTCMHLVATTANPETRTGDGRARLY